MKKTLLQMTLTCMVFGVIFAANNAVIHQDAAEPHAVSAAFAGESVKLPIIMYHSVLKDQAQAGKYVISPSALDADLNYLESHGYETVTVADLVRYVDELGELPEKPVMITFDDGHYNNYLYAYPLLKKHGMRAVISVIGKETEQYTESGQENAYWSYLTLDRLREISTDGVFEIQNHSYDLHENDARKGALRMRGESLESYRALLVEDTERTQKLLIEGGVPTPICYTYPYGACSRESEEVIKSLGFLCTLGCEERVNTLRRGDADCLYRLGRYNRPTGVSAERFLGKILGE
ncbi:MAG: polysaccharide deacetylase family protein [Butyricicoccus pullicaecorum]|nr:polysaccharide deacetylase family protein [Butyricicoccus pullicaecorum]